MEPISGKMDKKVVFSTCCGMKLYAVTAPSEKEHCCEAVNCGSVHHLGCEAVLGYVVILHVITLNYLKYF